MLIGLSNPAPPLMAVNCCIYITVANTGGGDYIEIFGIGRGDNVYIDICISIYIFVIYIYIYICQGLEEGLVYSK